MVEGALPNCLAIECIDWPVTTAREISSRSAKVSANLERRRGVGRIPIGFSSLKNIVQGKTGAIHLRIWDSSFTGKGYGAVLFCMSAMGFYAMFNLESIKCEHRASNPLPNRMFQKLGFPLVKTYVGASSELSLPCELNRYAITRDIAEQYLESLKC